MSIISGVSTDRLNESPNPKVVSIVLEGTATMNINISGSWYSGSYNLYLPFDSSYVNLDVIAWVRTQGEAPDYSVRYYRIPEAALSASGTLVAGGSISIGPGFSFTDYKVGFSYVTQTAQSVTTWPLYYKIYSTQISPDGIDFDALPA